MRPRRLRLKVKQPIAMALQMPDDILDDVPLPEFTPLPKKTKKQTKRQPKAAGKPQGNQEAPAIGFLPPDVDELPEVLPRPAKRKQTRSSSAQAEPVQGQAQPKAKTPKPVKKRGQDQGQQEVGAGNQPDVAKPLLPRPPRKSKQQHPGDASGSQKKQPTQKKKTV